MNITADGWYRAEVPVRFRDLDAMGHAHHTLPLIYLEEARAAFWAELKGSRSLDAIDYVMAEITLRFHARIRYPSNITVALAVRHVGTKSFTTDFEVSGADGAVLASGSAVQVAYDYGAGRARPIDAAERDVLEAWLAAARSSTETAAGDGGMLPAGTAGQNSSAMPAETAPIIPPST